MDRTSLKGRSMDADKEAQVALPFASHSEFDAHFRRCIASSRERLDWFDPDFAVFPLGASEIDAALRHFIAGGGHIRLAAHRDAYITQHYPRFLRLLRDFSHRIECRITSRGLHHLTDSFCIGDGVHIVRRFHSDHLRGEAAFDLPAATETSIDRFEAIWAESAPGLHPSTTGL
jgi:hypothetical protein